ncbi:MAG TPA: CDP-alcohol phosphatidyltransferase family protein [Candidatus Dormibacteraeota bacterium]|nr:CDP-alcohol phosphatidyltransferase family protein [Candidatus Dormibacteraeota bacterium]
MDEVGAAGAGGSGVGGLIALYGEAFALLRARPALRRSLLRWCAAGLVFTEAYTVGVAQLVSPRAALLSALGAVVWWLFFALVLVGGATLLFTHPDHRRIDHYGIPNGLTAIRAWSCLPLLLTAALPLRDDLGLILWCSIGGPLALLDAVDGLIARRIGPLTDLGRALDPAGDALFFPMAAVGGALVGILPWWLCGLIVVRYVGPLLATPFVFLSHRRPELSHTHWGRRNTVAVGWVFFILMWVRLLHGPTEVVALVLAIPTVGGTLVLYVADLVARIREAPVVP